MPATSTPNPDDMIDSIMKSNHASEVELQDCLSAFCSIKFSPNTLTSNPLTQFALSNPRLQPERNFALDMFPQDIAECF